MIALTTGRQWAPAFAGMAAFEVFPKFGLTSTLESAEDRLHAARQNRHSGGSQQLKAGQAEKRRSRSARCLPPKLADAPSEESPVQSIGIDIDCPVATQPQRPVFGERGVSRRAPHRSHRHQRDTPVNLWNDREHGYFQP